MKIQDLPSSLVTHVRRGMVIPACPLALRKDRKWDERRQKALVRYYLDAGAGGLAVGVHTTQFEIRDPKVGLFEPVLTLASETMDMHFGKQNREIFKVAGVCGGLGQALKEARFARDHGYHACLLSLAALANREETALVEHCRAVAEEMPIIGFYLQPAAGGGVLPYSFWRRFAEIENVLAIKMAPFNRYQTWDVVRAVCEAGREREISLYTGNDDHIVLDLLTPFCVGTSSGVKTVSIVGGLLGHWAVWTSKAAQLLDEIQQRGHGKEVPAALLTRAVEVTDANAAFFDAAHGFAGCIAGIHEVLRRQGLLEGIWCLNPKETLSAGQKEEIDRVYQAYPHLNDDAFVRERLDQWLAG